MLSLIDTPAFDDVFQEEIGEEKEVWFLNGVKGNLHRWYSTRC